MKRVYILDLFRFFAAISVLMYHYTFAGYLSNKMSLIEFSHIGTLFRYGYLGVNFFFIISGFVILLTAQNKNYVSFIISRFLRLYPAFWVSVTISAIFIYFFGNNRFNVTFFQYIVNLSMVSDLFHVNYIDGVYWTLLVEMKFYFLIWLLIVFKQLKNIQYYAIGWLFISLLNYFITLPRLIVFFFVPSYTPYFVAGIVFFLIYKSKLNYLYVSILLCSFSLVILYLNEHALFLSSFLQSEFSITIIVGIMLLVYVVFFLVSIKWLKIKKYKVFMTFGVMTYPLYLTHENIGFSIFNLYYQYTNKYILLISITIIMLIISLTIHVVFEKRIVKFFKNFTFMRY